ncbi:4-(cytidine 5'-diphospho)-2-C-methyl-D-erythritol kinase [Thermodesulfovibrio sp.]|uniref:4-(cytidine 5'-diphospho)-2-C-methyl-D-erythritol kinase n=1 Tax=Thermodesulfovibrio sp. TaxID=2067987 RepID=UPI0030B7CDA4
MFIFKSPAKINWALYILKKRVDGYHDIVSLINTVDLYDTLIFEKSSSIEVHCNYPIRTENNLVYKAAKLLQEYKQIKEGVKITVRKEIPIGAGLGGGSSNAAITMKALNELWKLSLTLEELNNLAMQIGSDVPFFLNTPLCLVEGKGDKITPLKIEKTYHLLIVKPSFSISTRWAYESFDAESQLTENYEKINNNIWLLYKQLCEGVIDNKCLWNDLEQAVVKKYREIDFLKRKLLSSGAVASLMSGSGSTVYGVFESKESAIAASKEFIGYWTRVVQTLVEE